MITNILVSGFWGYFWSSYCWKHNVPAYLMWPILILGAVLIGTLTHRLGVP